MIGQRNDQRRALDAGEERARQEQSELRVAPAHERLDTRRTTRYRIEARLVEHLDLATFERIAEVTHQGKAPSVVDVRIRCVQRMLATSACLGLVHRDVTCSQQLGYRVAVDRKQRHPDARADVDLHPVEQDGFAHRVKETLCHDPCAVCPFRVAHHGTELVATKPGDQLVLSEFLGQSACDDAKELVADMVSQRVVDILEPVKVHEQHRHIASSGSRLVDRVGEMAEQHPAIRQARQLVAERLFAGVEQREVLAKREGGADQGDCERRARQPHGCFPQLEVVVGDECRDRHPGEDDRGEHHTHLLPARGRRVVPCAQPARERDDQEPGREPGTHERADRHLADRHGVGVDAVGDGQHSDPEGERHPAWPDPPVREREVRDQARQDQNVAQRVGDVRRDSEQVSSEGVQYRFQDDCREDGRDRECADQSVEK